MGDDVARERSAGDEARRRSRMRRMDASLCSFRALSLLLSLDRLRTPVRADCGVPGPAPARCAGAADTATTEAGGADSAALTVGARDPAAAAVAAPLSSSSLDPPSPDTCTTGMSSKQLSLMAAVSG